MNYDMRPEIEHPPHFTQVTGQATTEPPRKVFIVKPMACGKTEVGYTNCTSNEPKVYRPQKSKTHPFAKFIKHRRGRP